MEDWEHVTTCKNLMLSSQETHTGHKGFICVGTTHVYGEDITCRGRVSTREFKQMTTAGATTAAVTEKVWGEYISVVCQILSLASKAKYKDERNIG